MSFKQPLLPLTEEKYLKLITIFVMVSNFLPGLVIDIYSPSLPQVALDFHISSVFAKNTITATILGYACGGFTIGALFDKYGRKLVLSLALVIFAIVSILAGVSDNIYQLLFCRFIEGLTAAAISVGCRVIVSDHFSGTRMTVNLLYVSLGFGLGTVVAPFIGAYIQEYINWRANFWLLAFYGIALVLLISLFIHERSKQKINHNFISLLRAYLQIFKNTKFITGVLTLSVVQMIMVFYATVGPFVIEHHLHYSPIVYGKTALIVSLGYLIGTIINRLLLVYLGQIKLIGVGFFVQFGAVIIAFFCVFNGVSLDLLGMVLIMTLAMVACGFLVGNINGICLHMFDDNIGTVASTMFGSIMLIASIGNYFIAFIHIRSFLTLGLIFLSFLLLQIFWALLFMRRR